MARPSRTGVAAPPRAPASGGGPRADRRAARAGRRTNTEPGGRAGMDADCLRQDLRHRPHPPLGDSAQLARLPRSAGSTVDVSPLRNSQRRPVPEYRCESRARRLLSDPPPPMAAARVASPALKAMGQAGEAVLEHAYSGTTARTTAAADRGTDCREYVRRAEVTRVTETAGSRHSLSSGIAAAQPGGNGPKLIPGCRSLPWVQLRPARWCRQGPPIWSAPQGSTWLPRHCPASLPSSWECTSLPEVACRRPSRRDTRHPA